MNYKIKIIFHLFILFLSIISFSSAQTSSSNKNDYMPLSIGNKWYYNSQPSNVNVGSEISNLREVIRIDKIKNKKYFVISYSIFSPNKTVESIFYQRISNDTLFTLTYDQKSNLYFERVTAIFTLDSGDVARIELLPNELSSRNEAQGLPTGRRYLIKAINKDKETIELYTNVRGVDGNYTETYKRGIGMIKSKNDWGIVTELIDYELNN